MKITFLGAAKTVTGRCFHQYQGRGGGTASGE